MVYRALGDVDRALECRGRPTAGVLKTIERFAVECSVNKVYTSEALAYVVDEAVQVFGGNGYSREFPVERAYRDARITRIYEGTNEINRMIIPTRLLKGGSLGSQGGGSRGRITGVRVSRRFTLVGADRIWAGQGACDLAAEARGHVGRRTPARAGSSWTHRRRGHRRLCGGEAPRRARKTASDARS